MSYDTYNTNTYTAAIAHAVRVMNDHQRNGKARVAAERAYRAALLANDVARVTYRAAAMERAAAYNIAEAASEAYTAAQRALAAAEDTLAATEKVTP